MTELPLRNISISDFRRLSGHRTLPLDAPIVLIHGPNGTGKTSILAALEMGLTGQIRTMRRQDARYTAYLPHLGQDFATIRVDVDERFAAGRELGPLTVGGSRIEGPPALQAEVAAFFAERCYLDQVSLGQLLELYQYREGKEESALARFVNELLGLEQLDALRSGLSDANDLRNLKNLSRLLDQAADSARIAGDALTSQSAVLQRSANDLVQARADLLAALEALGERPDTADDAALANVVGSVLREQLELERLGAVAAEQDTVALSGRMAAFLGRPSTTRRDAAEMQQKEAKTAIKAWEEQYGATAQSIQQEVSALGPSAHGSAVNVVDEHIALVQRELDRQVDLADQVATAEALSAANSAVLADVTHQVEQERELAGNLVEGLAAIRASLPADAQICPVCDRDFSEVSRTHLGAHIDAKLAELNTQGQRLLDLRAQRDEARARTLTSDQALTQLRASVLTPEQLGELVDRRSTLSDLRRRALEIEPAMARRRNLQTVLQDSYDRVQRLQEATVEESHIDSELTRLESALGIAGDVAATFETRLELLAVTAYAHREAVDARLQSERDVRNTFAAFRNIQTLLSQATQAVAQAAQKKQFWESRVEEARRRQRVARDVHAAAGQARTAVVQHVFTESLNQVWGSVFSRLAPREEFIPSFGVPTATKAALELTLQTTHVTGEAGGSPQMMLSAGNLNTAALSLFLALHLAVEPIMPCLVFDDPVQAMDEVHVAQFAGLVRTLSKHHGRQVVIAVHERELFEYLALELSPAYAGDELITIELGDRTADGTELVTRKGWVPDLAIAT